MSLNSLKKHSLIDDEIMKYEALSTKRQAIDDQTEVEDETQIVTLREIISGRDAMAIVEESGENITLLQEKTGAQIFLSENVLGSIERILTCIGTAKSVAKAISLVIRLLHNEDLDTVSTRNDKSYRIRLYPATFQKVLPNNTMLTPANPYGIAPNAIMQQNYPMSNYMPVDPQAIAAYNVQQQNQVNSHTTKPQPQSQQQSQPQPQPQPQQPQSSQQSPQQSQQSSQSQQSQQSQPAPGQPITQQIFIPNDMVGAIIGKGGTKINEIRQLSGSHIKINEPADNSAERLVTITGTPECNQMALYMLY
ncbi:hypothetical protein PCK1_001386 [Pneumocystis canis]|nr:hypothetical protein PCK1_001386 [Pneumocystis canis]